MGLPLSILHPKPVALAVTVAESLSVHLPRALVVSVRALLQLEAQLLALLHELRMDGLAGGLGGFWMRERVNTVKQKPLGTWDLEQGYCFPGCQESHSNIEAASR